jgi:phage shock protein C
MTGPVSSDSFTEPEYLHDEYEPDGAAQAAQSPQGRRLLKRSKRDRVIGGVCVGLARYVDSDPILFRIAFLLLLAPGGFGLLIYIIAWIAMPEFKTVQDEDHDSLRRPLNQRSAAAVVGGVLIMAGVLIPIQRFIDWFDPRIVGGGLLILIGVYILMRGLKREGSA